MTETAARRIEWTMATARRLELAIAGLLAIAIAAVMTWPTLAHPMKTVPGDYGDPTIQAWQVAWAGHILLTDPTRLWQANSFYPERNSFTFGDTLLGYAPAGMIGSGPDAAILRYNLLFVLAFALASFGAYVLARQLGAARAGALVAGLAFAYAPWRLGHVGHLNVLSTGGIPLSLAMLARGHGWSLRPRRQAAARPEGEPVTGSEGEPATRPEGVRKTKPAWVVAGWAVAAWQLTLGFGLGLPFFYVLLAGSIIAAVWCLVSSLRRRRPFDRRLLLANLGGSALFGIVALLMALPFMAVARDHPDNARTASYLRYFSPHVADFGLAPERDWLWGPMGAHARLLLYFPDEISLLPGVTVLTLAVLGLLISAWRLRWRLALAGGVLLAGALALGPNLGDDGNPGYMTLFRVLPGWEWMRTPGRLILWAMLPLVLLGAGTVTFALTRARPARDAPLRARLGRLLPMAAALLLGAMVAVEGVSTAPAADIPDLALPADKIQEPMLLLPLGTYLDGVALLKLTDTFPRMVNGVSTIAPSRQEEIRKATAYFPNDVSVAYLRKLGIRTVVVLPDEPDLGGRTFDIHKPIDGLGITRIDLDNEAIYYLS